MGSSATWASLALPRPARADGALGPEAGDAGQPRLGAGGQPGDDDQQDGAGEQAADHETVGAGEGPVSPFSSRQPSTMACWRPNISAFSPGSSWS